MAYTINLTHRGPQVIECIDLFDEARYGADKLFFRGRFEKTKDILDQVTFALTKDSNTEEWGNGNPLEEETSDTEITVPTIALNRYHIPNKKFWNNTPPSDVENPYKASAAVRFSIRVHFRDDFAYIDFGCPWELVDKGTLDATKLANDFITNFKLLHCHFISKEDALQILQSIFEDTDFTASVTVPQIQEEEIMTTELIDEDGTIIAL